MRALLDGLPALRRDFPALAITVRGDDLDGTYVEAFRAVGTAWEVSAASTVGELRVKLEASR